MIRLEVCVDNAIGIEAAVAGGADRIELCSALALGGLSPSAGLLALAAKALIPSMVMIRPRAGDFVWSEAEIAAMVLEIQAVRAAGLQGVVIGASLPDGSLDETALIKLVTAATGLDITLHRAIDLTPDPVAAMQLCAKLGIRRVLSSGGAQTALEGLARLQVMAKAAADVVVMPAGGVSEQNAALFASALPLREIHASCSSPLPAPVLPAVEAFGFQPKGAKGTNASRIRALRKTLADL